MESDDAVEQETRNAPGGSSVFTPINAKKEKGGFRMKMIFLFIIAFLIGASWNLFSNVYLLSKNPVGLLSWDNQLLAMLVMGVLVGVSFSYYYLVKCGLCKDCPDCR